MRVSWAPEIISVLATYASVLSKQQEVCTHAAAISTRGAKASACSFARTVSVANLLASSPIQTRPPLPDSVQ